MIYEIYIDGSHHFNTSSQEGLLEILRSRSFEEGAMIGFSHNISTVLTMISSKKSEDVKRSSCGCLFCSVINVKNGHKYNGPYTIGCLSDMLGP